MVLIVLQTKALYKSVPCLLEIHTALENGILIIPVRMEDDLPGPKDQWVKSQDSEDVADNMMAARVIGEFGKKNSLPARGTLLDQLDTELAKVVARVREAVGTAAIPGPVPVEHLAVQPQQATISPAAKLAAMEAQRWRP